MLKILKMSDFASENEYIFELSGTESSIHRMYSIIMTTHLKYEESRKYRDCIVEGGDFSLGKMKLLKGERMIVEEKEVWNATKSPFVEGIMIISNLRVIWYKKGKCELSVSIPYLCIQEIVEVESKDGKVIKIEILIYRREDDGEGKKKRLRGFFYFPPSSSLSLHFPPTSYFLFFSLFFFVLFLFIFFSFSV
jgi:hypothetical protein